MLKSRSFAIGFVEAGNTLAPHRLSLSHRATPLQASDGNLVPDKLDLVAEQIFGS